jgi:hypothetical protein
LYSPEQIKIRRQEWLERHREKDKLDYLLTGVGRDIQIVYGPPKEKGERYKCPCCQYKTLYTRGSWNICPVCRWKDDGQDDHNSDTFGDGANLNLTLTQARENFLKFGAKSPQLVSQARLPKPEEL